MGPTHTLGLLELAEALEGSTGTTCLSQERTEAKVGMAAFQEEPVNL